MIPSSIRVKEISKIHPVNNKTHRHAHWHTCGKLKAHRESVPLRVSTAEVILFKISAIGEFSTAVSML